MGFYLNGSTNLLITGGDAATHPTEYTFAIWVRPYNNSGTKAITNRSSGGGGNTHQILQTTVWSHYVWDGGTNYNTGTTTIVPYTWYHVVVTAKNFGFAYLYVNGISEGTPQDLGTMWASGDRWYFGGGNDPYAYFVGELGYLMYWNKQLSADEVKRLYNTSRTVPTSIYPSNILFHFPMNDASSGVSVSGRWNNVTNATFTQTLSGNPIGTPDILAMG